jgi:hypothetical protein
MPWASCGIALEFPVETFELSQPMEQKEILVPLLDEIFSSRANEMVWEP